MDFSQNTAAKPLRIIHIFRAPVGGLFRHVNDLATAQVRNGHQVGVVCDSLSGGAYEDTILRELGARLPLGLIRMPMRRQISPTDLVATSRMVSHIAGLSPDVVHGHGAKGGAYGRAIGTWLGAWSGRRQKVARIYTPHGGSMHYDPAGLKGRVYFSAERLMERMTDALVHVSQFEANIYREKVQPPRCAAYVIPNGLRAEEFEPVTPDADARDLLFLGAFRDLKGIDVLIEALARLKTEGLRVTANLVGQPEGRAAYIELASQRGLNDQVAFHDPMQARAAFATARAVIVPSRAESMPYVVLEAIAAGLPTLSSNVGGIPEIYGPFANELLPAGDAGALAAAIASLLADPARAQQQAKARHDWLMPRFNIGKMESDISGVYHTILDGEVRRAA
jgi:glycosyltransferase involved in cell wall biosynthesis